MFNNVLVGVDGRRGGRDAIALALRLAQTDARLALVHVHAGCLRPSRAVTPGRVREETRESHELLECERADADVTADLVSVEATTAGRGLHEQAEERRADLLVVGSCERGPVGRVMLGDDTSASLNGAPCAVAIASIAYSEHPHSIAKVGVAYDGSQESKAALGTAREVAAPTRASVSALEVISLPHTYSGLPMVVIEENIDAKLDEANRRMKQLEGVDGRAVYGLAGEGLASFGDELDLLVVGSRGYGPLKRLTLGSASHYLQRHARCSLLVLPRGASAGGHEPAADSERRADSQVASVA